MTGRRTGSCLVTGGLVTGSSRVRGRCFGDSFGEGLVMGGFGFGGGVGWKAEIEETGRAGFGGSGIGRRAWLDSFFCMCDNSSETFDPASVLRNTTSSISSPFSFSGESGNFD